MLTPVEGFHICEEPFTVRTVCKIPLVEAKIIVGFHKPMGCPLADMRMGLAEITGAIFGIRLGAFAVAWSELLPTPTVRKIELRKRNFQHDAIWKPQQASV